ncbi:MAG: 50S ribosomal protein L13 [Chlamydiota bacterium]|nr:50S ribosomal protein L13 [Chlamydiota bacterium]
MRTFMAKACEIERKWYIVDATGQRVGRLATMIADTLRGKNKPIFTPHVDCGDYVIVINAKNVVVTGNKESQKTYRRFTGYPGGLRIVPYKKMKAEHPDRIVKFAVKGMLPKGPLGRQVITKLKVYADETHPHQSQNPVKLEIQ